MTTTLLDEMAAARLPWISSQIASWYSGQVLLAQLHTSLRMQADWVGNEAFGRRFRDDVGTGGVHDPLAWANQRLDLPDGGWVVTRDPLPRPRHRTTFYRRGRCHRATDAGWSRVDRADCRARVRVVSTAVPARGTSLRGRSRGANSRRLPVR